MRVLGLGDNVCDKYLHTGIMYPGGNALNVAVFAKRLGAEAGYLGVFGDDIVGDHVSKTVGELGLDLSRIRRVHGENGFARATLVDGDRVFLRGNKGGVTYTMPLVLSDGDLEYLRSFDLIHTSVYSYIENEFPKLVGLPGYISMDFSDEFEDEYLKRCCPYLDAAEISCADMPEEEIRSVVKKIFDYGCRHIVIATRGSRGALVTVDGIEYQQSPCKVKATDTMGAGDSFIASFLVRYLSGMDLTADFPENSKEYGITDQKSYQRELVKVCLHNAAVFASRQVMVDGTFGYGIPFELSEEDRRLLEKASK